MKRRRRHLTARQREVAQLLRAGRSYRQIAAALGCEESTVRTHVEHLYRRLDITSRWELLDVPNRALSMG